MKIIGKTKEGYDEKYIAIVDHSELEKFMNQYYGSDKLKRLEVDQEIDLGKGHDFAQDAKRACQTTEKFIQDNKKMIETILSGISILGKVEDDVR